MPPRDGIELLCSPSRSDACFRAPMDFSQVLGPLAWSRSYGQALRRAASKLGPEPKDPPLASLVSAHGRVWNTHKFRNLKLKAAPMASATTTTMTETNDVGFVVIRQTIPTSIATEQRIARVSTRSSIRARREAVRGPSG